MDAILQAGDNIWNTMANISPATDKKQQAIDFLMDIFKVQAKKDESGTNTKKVCTEAAQSERVVIDEAD